MAMTDNENETAYRGVRIAAGTVSLLLGLVFLHVWLRVGPDLVYYHQRPVFLTGTEFLRGFLTKAGGLVEYLALFCTQVNYYPLAGALLFTMTAGLVCLAFWALIRLVAEEDTHPAWRLIPAILLMMVYSRYEHNQGASIQILASLIFAYIYARSSPRTWLWRLIAFFVISAVVYYLIGGGYLLFAALCGIVELLKRRNVFLGLVCLALGLAVPYGFAAYSYRLPLDMAYAPLLSFSKTALPSFAGPVSVHLVLHVALVAYFPLVTVWVGLRRSMDTAGLGGLMARIWAKKSGDGAPDQKDPAEPAQASPWTVRFCVLLVIALGVASTSSVDKYVKALLRLRLAAHNGQWERVLEQAALLPPQAYDMYAMRHVNTALYHKGRLSYEMFDYPQRLDRDSVFLAFAIPPGGPQPFDTLSEMYFELGFINDAEHYAHEALEEYPQSPRILKRLANINVLKGMPVAASTFMNALRKNPVHRKWAEDRLCSLRADPTMGDDQVLAQARLRMIRTDYVVGMSGTDKKIGPPMLRALQDRLTEGSSDRLAFDNVMAHYLRTKQLNRVVANLPRLTEMGYDDVPRHFQEAALLYVAKDLEKASELHGLKIGPEAREGMRRFLLASKQYGSDVRTLKNALMESQDRSYFLYYTAGFSDSRWASLVGEPSAVSGATK